MGTICVKSLDSEESMSKDEPSSSKRPLEDDALSRLMSKDPVLGEAMKVMMEKLDETNRTLGETNKKLDGVTNELRRAVGTCQDQINKLEVQTKWIEDEKTTIMETIQRVNAKESEKKRRQMIKDCFGLPTVLRQIMQYFPDKELIKLSLVNKLWNYEARSVLRGRDCLWAMIPSRRSRRNLGDFASDLEQMQVVPFTGIDFAIDRFKADREYCQSAPIRALYPSYQVILDRRPWKRLSVRFPYGWDREHHNYNDCPVLALVKRILTGHCRVLQELSFFDVDGEKTEIFQSVFREQSFPCLKVIHVDPNGIGALVPNGFMKTLVSSAPNLQELHVYGRGQYFNENFMEGSSAVLFAESGLRLLKEQVAESLIASLRTNLIDVCCDDDDGLDLEVLNWLVPMAIQASHTTLERLYVDLLFLVPLMCYRLCLENVTELCFCFTHRTVEGLAPNVLACLEGFDFTYVFPKLSKVKIMAKHEPWELSSDDIRAFVEQGNEVAVARNPLPDRASNIRHLKIHHNTTPPLIFLAQMFPHVKTLSIETFNLQRFPLTLLWEQFPCLEELHIDFDESISWIPSVELNFDSVFCGIFPEELAELREKDDEYLRAVNIVPVMPSISSMRGLRLLTFRYEPQDDTVRQDSTWVFSKVTCLIGFTRCPALSVELGNSPHYPGVLDHLKPYVPVVNEGSSMYYRQMEGIFQ